MYSYGGVLAYSLVLFQRVSQSAECPNIIYGSACTSCIRMDLLRKGSALVPLAPPATGAGGHFNENSYRERVCVRSACLCMLMCAQFRWLALLVRLKGRQQGLQARAGACSQALSPVVQVSTDPRWGRLAENYGEDPHLVYVLEW